MDSMIDESRRSDFIAIQPMGNRDKIITSQMTKKESDHSQDLKDSFMSSSSMKSDKSLVEAGRVS